MPFVIVLLFFLAMFPLAAQKPPPSSPGLAIEDELDLQKGKGNKKKKTPTDNQEAEDIADKN
ncbi:MAG TPA: hypothetical protein PKM44_15460, partial [Turneriella sp.]|nr:hypothetical protein [Turneriella sp.]